MWQELVAQDGGGAIGAAGEAENPFDPLHSVFAELAKNVKLDKAALREIKAHAASLKKSTLGISATQKRLTGIDEDLKALRENRIPNQLKPFSPGLEIAELEDVYNNEPTQVTLQVSFPAGCTFREAKEILHKKNLEFSREVDAKLHERRLGNQRAAASFDSFLARCVDASAMDHSIAMETLGLNFPGSGEQASKKAAEAKKLGVKLY